jgi:hypothetical protein
MLALFLCAASPLCTETFNISDTPHIFSRAAVAGEVICVNSSQPYFALLFNRWASCLVRTHRYTRDDWLTDGPYTSDSEDWGFDFGSHPSAAVDITVSAATAVRGSDL